MKRNFIKLLPIAFIAVLLFAFTSINQKNTLIPPPRGFVYIPSSTYTINGKTTSVQAFYMAETEVTNKQYNEFLNDLKIKGRMDEYNIAFPDTNNWLSEKYDLSILRIFYHSSKVYENYPVINISYEAAMLYCKWLSDNYEKKYNLKLVTEFRLPTKEEWDYVSKFEGKKPEGPYLFSLENKDKKQSCNYRKVDQEYIFFNDSTQKAEVYTKNHWNLIGVVPQPCHVKSYSCNSYGLYDLFGNVAEMTNEKGIAMGGSFYSFGGDIINNRIINYNPSSCEVGFRPVMTLISSK